MSRLKDSFYQMNAKHNNHHRGIITGLCHDLGSMLGIKAWIPRVMFVLFLLKAPIIATLVYFFLSVVIRNFDLLPKTISTCSGDIVDDNLAPKILSLSVIIISFQFALLMLIA